MNDKDDKIIQDFLNQHRLEMADNGFSERVMESLPQRQTSLISGLWSTLIIILMVVYFVASHCINNIRQLLEGLYHLFLPVAEKLPAMASDTSLTTAILLLMLFLFAESLQDCLAVMDE